ncbi:MAG: sugar phosphate isomerase/epimerase family protein [Terriglobales bacterium]
MKLSFSTLACPDWTMLQIIAIASASGYDGIELRFVQNEDSLWKLPAFREKQLADTKRALSDHGLDVSCVDTSCRFHFPNAKDRAQWLQEGERMADLAAALGAPGIRVFGDTIQPGADRPATRTWIADSLHKLAESIAPKGIEVWLETHGDFAGASETAAILAEASSPAVAVVWDPANCFLQSRERPREGAARLGTSIRHIHIKDLLQNHDGWKPTLTGEGNFPLPEVRAALLQLGYSGFVSFEWEKKWHPDIPDANIALPHFARWFRENYER